MLKRLKSLFLTLTEKELNTVWRRYILSKGKDIQLTVGGFRTAEVMWDYCESQGIYQRFKMRSIFVGLTRSAEPRGVRFSSHKMSHLAQGDPGRKGMIEPLPQDIHIGRRSFKFLFRVPSATH
jgi:hypothetical protein